MNCFRALMILCLVFAVLLPKSHCKFQVLDATFIQSSCNKTPKPSLCVSILRSDPRSSTADTTGLAKILVDKIKAKAEETIGEIKASYGKPKLKAGLDGCSRNYDAILNGDVASAKEALEKGNPKFAENGVADAGIEAAICGRRIAGLPKLTSLTKDMKNLSDIARAIVRMLL